jgi:hypothetical protein
MTLTERQQRPSDSPVSDVEVLFKEAKIRQRRRRLGWLIVVICVAAATTLLITRPTGGPAPTQKARHGSLRSSVPVKVPDEIVAWTSSSHVVVISTRTGAVIRTLASHVEDSAPGLPDLTVSPQGVVFFNSAPIAGVSPPEAQGDQIFSVPISGGAVREVAAGFFPQVSPNGKYLAYVTSNGVGEAPYMLPNGGIAIATLVGDTVSGVQTLHPNTVQSNQGASDLSWSLDSQRLSFALLNGSTDTTTSWTIALAVANGSLASAREIPLRPGVSWSGYWKAAMNGEQVGIGVQTSQPVDPPLAGSQAIVTINPSTGNVIKRLFAIKAAAVCSTSLPSDCQADFVNPLSVDAAGTGVLIGGAIPLAFGSVSTSGASYLYRGSAGDSKPVRLTPAVQVATWGTN